MRLKTSAPITSARLAEPDWIIESATVSA